MTRDRLTHITIGGKSFAIIVSGEDKHWWKLANPDEQQEFDELWAQMEAKNRDGMPCRGGAR